MRHNGLEILVGAVVLCAAAGFVSYGIAKTSRYGSKGHYTLYATFGRVDGLNVGSEVRLNGLAVGKVEQINLNPQTYQITTNIQIRRDVKLPKDSSAEIVTDGLLGKKYLALVPGADDNILQAGETIAFTQSSISLEAMIGQVIFSKTDEKK